MKLYYMPQELINELKGNFRHYSHYYRENDRKGLMQELSRYGELRESKIECEDFSLERTADLPDKIGRSYYYESDVDNIKIIYDHLKDRLDLNAASDEKLWDGMSHSWFWDYIQFREAKKLKSDKDADVSKACLLPVKKLGIRRARDIHCLSRLWWAGYYTYDEENKENPYALTEFYFSGALPSRMLLLSSRNFIANKNICIGTLRSLKKRYERGDRDVLERYHAETAFKYLNGIGGATSLDFLDSQEIEELVDNVMDKKYGKV